MYNPISTEFFDQLTVAMERQIPSKIEYYQSEKARENGHKSFSKDDGNHRWF